VAIVHNETGSIKLPVNYVGKAGEISLPAWQAIRDALAHGSIEQQCVACQILQDEVKAHNDSAPHLITSPEILDGFAIALKSGDIRVIHEVCTVIKSCSLSAGSLAGKAIAQRADLMNVLCKLSVQREDSLVIETLTRLSHNNEEFLWLVKTLIGVIRVQLKVQKATLRRVFQGWRAHIERGHASTRMEILRATGSIRVGKPQIETKQRVSDVDLELRQTVRKQVMCDVSPVAPPRSRVSQISIATDAVVTNRMCDVDDVLFTLKAVVSQVEARPSYSSVRIHKEGAPKPAQRSLYSSWTRSTSTPAQSPRSEIRRPLSRPRSSSPARDMQPVKRQLPSLYTTQEDTVYHGQGASSPSQGTGAVSRVAVDVAQEATASHDLFLTQNSVSGAPRAGLYVTADGQQFSPPAGKGGELSDAEVEAEYAKAMDKVAKEQHSAYVKLAPQEPDSCAASLAPLAAASSTHSTQTGMYASTSSHQAGAICDVDDYLATRRTLPTGPDWVSAEPLRTQVCDVEPYITPSPMETHLPYDSADDVAADSPVISHEPEEERSEENTQPDATQVQPACKVGLGQTGLGPKAQQVESKATGPGVEQLADDQLPQPVNSNSLEESDDEDDWC